jgi:hypothetical protein
VLEQLGDELKRFEADKDDEAANWGGLFGVHRHMPPCVPISSPGVRVRSPVFDLLDFMEGFFGALCVADNPC